MARRLCLLDRLRAHPPRGSSVRDCLVVLLAVCAGASDVTAFLVLGNVFSSVITGNLVLLGLAAAGGHSGLALRSGLALAGFSAGVLVAAPIARLGRRQIWPAGVTAALGAEFCLLLAFTAGWEAARQRAGWHLALLVLLAAAMGVQSAAVRQLGDMSSTYVTGTLTSVLAALVTGNRRPGMWRDVSTLLAVVVGACAGGALIRLAPNWLPAATLLPLGMVIAAAGVFRRALAAIAT